MVTDSASEVESRCRHGRACIPSITSNVVSPNTGHGSFMVFAGVHLRAEQAADHINVVARRHHGKVFEDKLVGYSWDRSGSIPCIGVRRVTIYECGGGGGGGVLGITGHVNPIIGRGVVAGVARETGERPHFGGYRLFFLLSWEERLELVLASINRDKNLTKIDNDGFVDIIEFTTL